MAIEFVRQEWQLTTLNRRKHKVALCWMHHRVELHWLSKENISPIFEDSEKRSEEVDSIAEKPICKSAKTETDAGGISWYYRINRI